MTIELGPHQIKAIKEIKNGSILKGGVGTGKTRTALAYYYFHVIEAMAPVNGVGTVEPPRKPRDIYVITTAKKRDDKDWEKEAAQFRFGRDPDISLGGIKLTVDSWNQISKYEAVTNAFFVFDEQRAVGSGKWAKSFIKIAKANQWILLSATPGDNWLDYIPLFVAHGFFKNRTEFLREHVRFNLHSRYPKVDGYIGERHLEALRSSISVEMPYHRHTNRVVRNIVVEHDQAKADLVLKKRWHVFEDRPIRDAGELCSVARKLVNSDPARLGAVMALSEKHEKLIIFYNFDYELEALRTLASTLNIPMAEWNGHKHEEIPDTDRWLYLVQYTAGAEGWNCVTTNAMIFYSMNYSFKINEQAKGRIDRLNTPYTDLYYYILRSGSWIDTAIAKALTTKQNFNEKAFFKEQYGLAA